MLVLLTSTLALVKVFRKIIDGNDMIASLALNKPAVLS